MSNRNLEKQLRHGLNYSFGSQGLQNLAPREDENFGQSIVLTEEEKNFIAGRKSLEDQIQIMEKQLSNFNTLTEKMMYLTQFFAPDPAFSQQACAIVMDKLCTGALTDG